MGSVKLKLV